MRDAITLQNKRIAELTRRRQESHLRADRQTRIPIPLPLYQTRQRARPEPTK
jgi:hypothetical protein